MFLKPKRFVNVDRKRSDLLPTIGTETQQAAAVMGGGDGDGGTVFATEMTPHRRVRAGKQRVTTRSWHTVSAIMTHCHWSCEGIPCTEPDTTPHVSARIRTLS